MAEVRMVVRAQDVGHLEMHCSCGAIIGVPLRDSAWKIPPGTLFPQAPGPLSLDWCPWCGNPWDDASRDALRHIRAHLARLHQSPAAALRLVVSPPGPVGGQPPA